MSSDNVVEMPSNTAEKKKYSVRFSFSTTRESVIDVEANSADDARARVADRYRTDSVNYEELSEAIAEGSKLTDWDVSVVDADEMPAPPPAI
jgi:hypothetical protein